MRKNATAPKSAPEKKDVDKTTLTIVQKESEKKALTIEEIKRKNEVITRLTTKYDQLSEKKRKVENFKLSYEEDTAHAIVRDANGEVFESSSPKTIGKLLEFWLAEFSAAIAETETELQASV